MQEVCTLSGSNLEHYWARENKTDEGLTERDRTRENQQRVISKSRVFSERCEVLQCLKSLKSC